MEFLLKSDTVVGYTFQADNYCPGCTELGWARPDELGALNAEQILDLRAAEYGIDRGGESSFDSGDFPKVILAVMVDGPEPCGSCGLDLIEDR